MTLEILKSSSEGGGEGMKQRPPKAPFLGSATVASHVSRRYGSCNLKFATERTRLYFRQVYLHNVLQQFSHCTGCYTLQWLVELVSQWRSRQIASFNVSLSDSLETVLISSFCSVKRIRVIDPPWTGHDSVSG